MMQEEPEIKSDTPLHVSNIEVFENMANAAGYDIQCRDEHDETHEWTDLYFVRRKKVKGGLSLAIDNT